MGDFVHLHLHTEYSLLDGATRIKDIAKKAKSLGQSAVAITDHGVMYGAVEFYDTLTKEGVKPIIGCEVYVAPRSRFDKQGKADSSGNHLVLLCKNEVGYRNLCFLVSASFTEGFYMKPRIDMELLEAHKEGLIALSACLSGRIPSLILAGSMPEAEKCALNFKRIFGDDFYLEIQNHHMDDERKVAFGITKIHETTGIPLVATNDVHYLEKEDADTAAILMCVQTGSTITEGRPFGFSTDEYYFRSTEEMEALFKAYPGAIENTVKIAEKCNFNFTYGDLHLPTFTPEGNMTHGEKLEIDTKAGFEKRQKNGNIDFSFADKQVYLDRIQYELSVIHQMGFDAYFLIVSDFVNHAKTKGIPVGPGRGSGAGSLVAYCIGITDVDPIRFDLLFERFLNPERVSMPDFDIDFCYNRREEVIDYVKSKYGQDKVAQIVTFGTLACRAAIKDVGRALGMSYSAVDNVSKLIPRTLNITIDEALAEKDGKLKALYDSDPEVKKLIDISRKVEGMPRHASTHAAGVVMTERPTYEYVPLSTSGTGVVTQFDMNTDAKLGLVKFDFLGLRYLTVIRDAELEVQKKHPDFDITKIPLDDPKTFALMCDGRTGGLFQLESPGMRRVITKLQPSTIEDIIAAIALFRPGPMDSIDTFIDRKHGKAKIEYKIPEIAPILDVTYGCIVYQEQVMQICRTLAGYSYARADIVRRAMAKKKTEAMLAEREDFLAGAVARGIDKDTAAEIFGQMTSFAQYAFNKSHATAYAVLTYRTAYLKAHYPAEFYSALLTSVLNNTVKVREYIMDAAKCGVKVLRPDVNESGANFTVKDNNIRYGLLAIKNVGRPLTEAIEKERYKSLFTSFDSFVSRMTSDVELNRRTLEYLIKCGVFDSLGVTRKALLGCYENILGAEQQKSRNNITGQMDLFSISSAETKTQGFRYPETGEYSKKELLVLEKECSGTYFSGHLVDSYEKNIERLHPDKISDILADFEFDSVNTPKYQDKTEVTLVCAITAISLKRTKTGETMAIFTVDDKYGEMEVIAFPKTYKKYEELITEENVLVLNGALSEERTETDDGVQSRVSLRLYSVSEIFTDEDDPEGKLQTSLSKNDGKANLSHYSNSTDKKTQPSKPEVIPERIVIRVESKTADVIKVIERLSMLNSGTATVLLFDNSTKKYTQLSTVRISPAPAVLDRLRDKFGKENVVYQDGNA